MQAPARTRVKTLGSGAWLEPIENAAVAVKLMSISESEIGHLYDRQQDGGGKDGEGKRRNLL